MNLFHNPIPAFLAAALLVGVSFTQQPQQAGSKTSAPEPQKGRVLGIGGVFFKSEHPGPMRQWYAKNLGLADQGQGVKLPWREKDNPQQERATAWAIFPANSKYFEPSQLMVNYIVDDLDAILERLSKEGVRMDPKRQEASYGRFAWIYDPDGNKIELWQPLQPAK